MKSNSGYLEIIYGPMFSGKSSELMNRVRRCTVAKKKCLVVNYSQDNRYSKENVITTHDQIIHQAIKCQHLKEIMNLYQNYDIIAIDEGQFFDDIVEMSDKMANEGKYVIIACLDADYRREPFGNVTGLIPKAESATKLTAVCVYCGQLAAFTRRKIEKQEIQLIGSNDIYEPVCRQCYNYYEQIQNSKQAAKKVINKEVVELILTPLKQDVSTEASSQQNSSAKSMKLQEKSP